MEKKNRDKDFNKHKNTENQENKPPKRKFNFYWIYGILALIFIALQFFNWSGSGKEISWQEFERKMLSEGDVERIVIVNKEYAEVYIKPGRLSQEKYQDVKSDGLGGSGPHYIFTIGSVETFENKLEEAQKKLIESEMRDASEAERHEIAQEYDVKVEYDKRRDWGTEVFSWLIPIGLMVLLWVFLMRRMGGGAGGGQIFNIGKSKAQLFDKDTNVKVDFKDVAGLEEAKVEVMEIVDFLKEPKKYTQLGGKIPKGALLIGPPGTGKTLMAKAVAGEAGVPFFSMSGSDFVEMFVGVGASRVRDLFKQAKEKAPCIVFIDEIDAIGRARGKSPMTGANDERENTLNQLLSEMDGFGTNSGVIILAATNRGDILDRALLRPGRFDRQIHLELPDLEERKAIFKVHVDPIKISEKLDIETIARQTPGFSGADIANACNEAALIAARKNKEHVDRSDFMDAIDRIIGGMEKKSKVVSPYERKTIAYHESGHAAVSWLTKHANPLVKVTIVPRGKSLGAAWYMPEERQISTYEQMYDEICAALGGRAAEEIVFGTVSTGALNDLERITKQAYAMVVYFGLNKKIGNLSYYDSTGQQEYSFQKPYSEATAKIIDEEIKLLVERAYERSKRILTQNRDKLDKLASQLLDSEVIFREDLEKIFGKRPFEKKELHQAETKKIKPSEEKNKEKNNEAGNNNVENENEKDANKPAKEHKNEEKTSKDDGLKEEKNNNDDENSVEEDLTPKNKQKIKKRRKNGKVDTNANEKEE